MVTSDNTEIRATEGNAISARVAWLLNEQRTDDISWEELASLRRATLALEACQQALRAHGIALVGWPGSDWYVWTWRKIPPIPLAEQPDLPAPYQALRLAAYAMLAELPKDEG